VLIVRAEAGREWLGDRLRGAGSQVEYAAVYRREVHHPSAEQRAALAATCGVGDRAAVVLTSSEAVAALDRQLAEAPDIKAWLRRGRVLCSHPRIVQAAQSAGYGEARECEPTVASVLNEIDTGGCSEATSEATAPALAEARAP
jgi:uroporphyrinogen III methyltransferase/synthase